jgi:hypothetical protein
LYGTLSTSPDIDTFRDAVPDPCLVWPLVGEVEMSFAVVEADGSLRFKEDVDAPSKGCVRVSEAGLLLFALLLERVENMPAFGGSGDIGKSVAMLETAESCSRYRTL